MTATTPKGIPYPEGDNLITDGNEAMQAIAVKVDSMLPIVGVATVVIGSAANSGSAVVTFPVGRFTVPPLVVCTINSGPNASVMNAQATGITKDACSISLNHRDAGQTITTTGIKVVWMAYAAAFT